MSLSSNECISTEKMSIYEYSYQIFENLIERIILIFIMFHHISNLKLRVELIQVCHMSEQSLIAANLKKNVNTCNNIKISCL